MTGGDKVIFGGLLAVALILFFLSNLFFYGHTGGVAQVFVDGNLYGEYSLQEKDGKTLEIKTEFGYNKIVIQNGGVRVTESSCPDGLEISSGAIESSGEMLVCLPNRLVIRIAGQEETDGLSY